MTYGFDRAADARFGPVIGVRWVDTVGARRTSLERGLGLFRAEHGEGPPGATEYRMRHRNDSVRSSPTIW